MDGQSTSNFGNEPLLLGKHDSSTLYNRKAYIRFALTSLPVPNNEYVLNLNVLDSNKGTVNPTKTYTFEVYGLNQGFGEDWGEDTITWDNAPANDSGNDFTTDATSLGTFDIVGKGAGELVSFSSLSHAAMDTFIENDTDDQVTFMIARNTLPTDNDNYIHAFASRDSTSADGPSLESIPEASGVAVWGILGALCGGMGLRRRKR